MSLVKTNRNLFKKKKSDKAVQKGAEFDLILLVYLTGTLHINNISVNVPELAKMANFHL